MTPVHTYSLFTVLFTHLWCPAFPRTLNATIIRGTPSASAATSSTIFSFFHRRYFNVKPHEVIEWSVKIPSIYMDKDFVEREIEAAFNSWSSVANINFVKRHARDNVSKIVIGFFTENYHQMINNNEESCHFAHNGVIAHAYFPPIHEIHVRDAPGYFLTQRGKSGPSLFSTMVHEIGHVLSLRHSNHTSSIMYWAADLTRKSHFRFASSPFIDEDRQRIANIFGQKRSKIEIIL